MSSVQKITEAQFHPTIQTGVTLVDFYADWCGPCRMMAPHLDNVAQELQGKVAVVKLDVDQAQQVASTYHITSIPTLILFKEGKELDRVVGVRDAKQLKQFVLKAFPEAPSTLS